MKAKLIFLLMLCSFYSIIVTAQVPQGFNYQAIARDGTGAILANSSLVVKITIQTTIGGGSTMWQETHSVTTNQFGVMTLIIGTGTRIGGLTTFSAINWGAQNLFLKTEIDKGGGYILMGTTQLWSVPYSITADELTGSLDKLTVAGKAESMTEPLFEVKNNQGQTVFAVYNEGVRIYVSDGDTKGAKGGFAIGGFDMAKGVGTGEYMHVSKDSVRIYLNDSGAKGAKGGFAIGGFDAAKGVKHDYFQLSRDSIRMYFNNTPPVKGAKGGFAIGGFDASKSGAIPNQVLVVSDDSIRMYIKPESKGAKGGFAIGGYGTAKGAVPPKYLSVLTTQTNIVTTDSLQGFTVTNLRENESSDIMRMNKVNYFLGHESGLKTAVAGDNGKYNSFVGYQTGHENITGKKNVFLGYRSGYKNNAHYNVFVGNETGFENTTGYSNVFLGHQAGTKNFTGNSNTFLGYSAGSKNSTGHNNVSIGCASGGDITGGNGNVVIGVQAGQGQTSGDYNTFIGTNAGNGFEYGSRNVFIGYNAGAMDAWRLSDQLRIANSTAHTLISGVFGSTDALSSVNVLADLKMKGVIVSTSDIRLKKDLIELQGSLQKLLSLNGYYFYWNQDVDESRGMSTSRQIGLVAQEVEKSFPELIGTIGDYKAVDYQKFVPVIIEAMKEQNNIIDQQKEEISGLKERLAKLEKLISNP